MQNTFVASIAKWCRHTVHNLMAMSLMPALTEISTHRRVLMGTWSVAICAVCDCTLLYANMHHDQRY